MHIYPCYSYFSRMLYTCYIFLRVSITVNMLNYCQHLLGCVRTRPSLVQAQAALRKTAQRWVRGSVATIQGRKTALTSRKHQLPLAVFADGTFQLNGSENPGRPQNDHVNGKWWPSNFGELWVADDKPKCWVASQMWGPCKVHARSWKGLFGYECHSIPSNITLYGIAPPQYVHAGTGVMASGTYPKVASAATICYKHSHSYRISQYLRILQELFFYRSSKSW